MRAWVSFGLCVVVTAAPGRAGAGCPSADGCLMAKGLEAALVPQEACIDVRVTEDDCQCESWVSLENNCAVGLRAEDFTFGFCMIDGEQQHGDCPEIIPSGSWGAVYLPTDANAEPGAHHEELHLTLSGRAILLRVDYEIRRVETGCGCGAGATGNGTPGLLLLLPAGALSLRARRRAAGCR